MMLIAVGLSTKKGIGIHLSLQISSDGAGLGGVIWVRLPKIYVSLILLLLKVTLTIGDVREERNAIEQLKADAKKEGS